jgi:hypothetical protein
MRASLIFSSTSHSINVQKVHPYIYSNIPAFMPQPPSLKARRFEPLLIIYRSSKSSSPKRSILSVPSQKSKMSANPYSSTNPSPRSSAHLSSDPDHLFRRFLSLRVTIHVKRGELREGFRTASSNQACKCKAMET